MRNLWPFSMRSPEEGKTFLYCFNHTWSVRERKGSAFLVVFTRLIWCASSAAFLYRALSLGELAFKTHSGSESKDNWRLSTAMIVTSQDEAPTGACWREGVFITKNGVGGAVARSRFPIAP